MKSILFFFLTAMTLSAHAQYYYNDIVATQETNRQQQTYIANKVRTVSAEGYTAQNSKSTDFAEVREVRENGRLLKVSSNVEMKSDIVYNRFDEKGRLTTVTDTTASVISITTYQYDGSGRINRVENKTIDDSADFNQVEVHEWHYSPEGKIQKMWRTINGTDSTEIRFVPEENGNPGEEVSYKMNYETGHIYYYYDNKNRLTDIVRYNKKLKKLLPDIIFTYDDNDRVIQKVISSDEDNYGLGKYGNIVWIRYIIWRYVYNEKGLRSKEALFNKDQQLTGKIEYEYTFGQ